MEIKLDTYNYWLLDPRKPGRYSYEGLNFSFLYEPFYTGISEKENRREQHFWDAKNERGNNKFKNRIINKILRDTKNLPHFLVTNEKTTWVDACELENFYIKTVGRRNKGLGSLVNLTDGGEGNPGRVVSQETREKLRNHNLGKTPSEATRKLWREQRGGENHPQFGIPRTEDQNENARTKMVKYKYVLISPDGQKYETNSLRKFVKEHDLHFPTIQGVVSGRIGHSKGWIGWIVGKECLREHINLKKLFNNGNQKWEYEIVSPLGQIFVVRKIKEFCKNNNLNYSSFEKACRDCREYFGWKITKKLIGF